MVVIANVVVGGMRSIAFVQAFQRWLTLTAVAVPALVLAVSFLTPTGTPPAGTALVVIALVGRFYLFQTLLGCLRGCGCRS